MQSKSSLVKGACPQNRLPSGVASRQSSLASAAAAGARASTQRHL